jgi:hypothetical protein
MTYKRSREATCCSKNVIEEVFRAVTSVQRSRIFNELLSLSDVTILVKSGLIHALCLQLGFVLNRSVLVESESDQIALVCQTIDSSLMKCRDRIRLDTFAQIGNELLRLLERAWKRINIHSRVLSIWKMFTASPEGAIKIIQSSDFVNVIFFSFEHDGLPSFVNEDTTCVIHNISLFAEEYRTLLLEHVSRLVSSLRISNLSELSSENMSASFRNLSLHPTNRLAMAEHFSVLNVLVQLCTRESQNVKTLRNVVSTLGNISLDYNSCMLLLFHGDGVILTILLHLLTKSDDEVVRRRSARALRLIARDRIAPLLVQSTDILDRLRNAALKDKNIDVRDEATVAYTFCVGKVCSDMLVYNDTLETLMEMAKGPHLAAVAYAFHEQVQNPENRNAIIEKGEFLDIVARCGLSSPYSSTAAKESITCAIEILSRDESLCYALLSEPVLQLLVGHSRAQTSSVREYAIKALLNLAATRTTHKQLVTHRGFLQSLISYSKGCQDIGVKEHVKRTMLSLIPII